MLYLFNMNVHFRILTATIFFLLPAVLHAQEKSSVHWREALKQEKSWYSGTEAARIADNVLLYQHNNGGWSKNIDMAERLSEGERKQLLAEKSTGNTTIDNKATFTQMEYLLMVHEATGQDKYREAFIRGVDYLLDAQYENGGWPQYYPIRKGYYEHITYNDGAMIGVMQLLKKVGQGESRYGVVDAERRKNANKAVEKGLAAILKTQVRVDGELTAWCAQHDRKTLAPAKARAYELPSLSGGESVGIVKYLMEIEEPGPEVVRAVEGAVNWFEEVQISGLKLEKEKDPSLDKGYDLVVKEDSSASPLWARFYEIGTNRPMFTGRDGIIKDKLSEIEYERRVGYSYYVSGPRELLEKNYPEWKQKRMNKEGN